MEIHAMADFVNGEDYGAEELWLQVGYGAWYEARVYEKGYVIRWVTCLSRVHGSSRFVCVLRLRTAQPKTQTR
jgi:hypothetical protein